MIKYKVLQKMTEYGNYILPREYGFGRIYINFSYNLDNIEIEFEKNKNRMMFGEMHDLMTYISSVKEDDNNSSNIRKIKNTISSYITTGIISSPNSSASINHKMDTVCGNNDIIKDLKHDIKMCLDNYILNKREMVLKEIFFERIKYSMPHNEFNNIKLCGSNYIDYYVVPLNADIFTTDVRNMMLVKSYRTNLYCDIINETLSRIREGIIVPPNNNKYFQLDNVLKEDMIPFV